MKPLKLGSSPVDCVQHAAGLTRSISKKGCYPDNAACEECGMVLLYHGKIKRQKARADQTA